MITGRRQLTPAQRSAKIERDRRRRRDLKMEFERLQNKERELQDLVTALRNENSSLRDENGKLHDMVPKLHNTISQIVQHNRQLRHKNLQLQQIMNLADSWFEFDKSLSPNDEVANNGPITEGPRGSQSGTLPS